MSDAALLSNHWQDWVVTLGYVSFALFITWRVLTANSSE